MASFLQTLGDVAENTAKQVDYSLFEDDSNYTYTIDCKEIGEDIFHLNLF